MRNVGRVPTAFAPLPTPSLAHRRLGSDPNPTTTCQMITAPTSGASGYHSPWMEYSRATQHSLPQTRNKADSHSVEEPTPCHISKFWLTL
mmetsp:Transcript_132050/g.228893  ORF Transcript_132050/g.228893 Transcript_132050/m.228893 type:complete len:90 (+) Transcript_132050:191-460(+)